MAISVKDRYPSKIDTTDAAYPEGKARNIVNTLDGTGTPFEKDLVNDIFGLQQAIYKEAGITPSGTPDTADVSQQLEGIKKLTQGISTSTTTDLINSTLIYSADTVITTSRFTTSGTGGAPWKQTGVTGETASQTPAQIFTATGNGGLLNDGNGNQWRLIDTLGIIDIKQMGVLGDNSSYDHTLFNAATNYCISKGYTLHVSKPQTAYLLNEKWNVSGQLDITCDSTGFIRWDSTDEAKVGVEIQFSPSGQLCSLDFPCLMGPAIDSTLSLPGYGSGLQDPTTRIGSAVQMLGGNRINITVQIANGFKTCFLPQSTAASTCDNINFTINTSDFCERFVHADSTQGFGLAQINVKANTVWAKRIFNSNTTTGYINGINIDIEGTAFVNESGGCGVYTVGEGLRSSHVNINQLQAGWRDDSTLDIPVTLIPTSAMSATPVDGETITQASSGASGKVVINNYYTRSSDSFFTVEDVSGTFNTVNELSGSISGALGAGSVPSSIVDLVCPWIGGNLVSNTALTDVEQTGTIGYFGGKHCEITIGAPMNHPAGVTRGAFNMYPKKGETTRLRDNGTHNSIHIDNAHATGGEPALAPVILSSTIGESNFDGGLGSAKFADYVYCSVTVTALAAGSSSNFFLYHGKVSDTLSLTPLQVIAKNDGIANNNLEVVAFADTASNNRQCRVNVFNRAASPVTATIFFFVKVSN